MEKLYVTQDGLDRMNAELAECRSRTKEVAAEIEHALSFGDLRENADYHAAKEEQAMLHARIRDIGDKIARAVVVDETQIDPTKAYLGATVRVLNKKTGKESTFTLVSPVETNMSQGKLSVRSPVGAALLGKGVGDEAVADVPAGQIQFEVIEITR